MPTLVLITLISLIMENSGDSVRYVVTLTPNWNHIYIDDSVTLKCDIGPNKNINKYNFYWFKDKKKITQQQHEFTISNVQNKDAGVYKCWTGSGSHSHPLSLHVIKKDLKDRTIVNFSPNYRNIFFWEKINISCEFGSPAAESEKYVWYKDNKKIKDVKKDIILESVGSSDSGSYTCGKRSRSSSYPARLDVYSRIHGKVILQTPPNILEGDSLDLRCHSYTDYNDEEEATIFYKDGAIIQQSKHILHLPNVNKSLTGIYQCEMNFKSSEEFIFVQDVFTNPEIQAPSSLKEGDALTVTCNIRRNPLREDAELWFTFYRNGQTVQKFRSSDTYKVQSAQLEDSGNYTCEVQTPLGSVRKMSRVSYITIQESMVDINITTDKEGEDFILGESLTFTCSVQRGTSISVFWQHNGTLIEQSSERYQLQDNRKVLYIPSLQYHHTGTYQCSAGNKRSVNRMFSALSEVRHVNVMELSQAGMNPNEESENKDRLTADNQNTTTSAERIYENTSARNNPDGEHEGCKYITVKAVQAPSYFPAAASREDFTVVYSVIEGANVPSDTKEEQRTPKTSDPTNIYQDFTAEDINNH